MHYKYDAETEWSDHIETTLKDTIARYIRPGEGVDRFYIGRTSGGSDWEEVLRKDYDEFKQNYGLNYVICIFESTNEKHALEIVKLLTDYYSGAPSFVEVEDRPPARDHRHEPRTSDHVMYHYVYLAFRKLWELDEEDNDDDVFM